MAFEVPPLPYDYAALEPTIDEQTMRLHHDKHHQAYVDNANAALAGTQWEGRPVEKVLVELAHDLVALVDVALVELEVRLDRLARDAVKLQQRGLELPGRDLLSIERERGHDAPSEVEDG